MSRSHKKNPILGVCKGGRKNNAAKKLMTRRCRQKFNKMDDPGKNNWYKKLEHSYAWDATDGKIYRGEWIKDCDNKEWWNRMGK